MTQPKAAILPMYLVADESGSMQPVVEQLNGSLASLLEAVQQQPFVAAKVRFGVVGFSDSHQVHLELADLRNYERMPRLEADGTTSYRSVFQELKRLLSSDVASLKAQGYSVHRPAVFFLSDGVPNSDEDWQTPLAELTDPSFPEHPNLMAFGLGEADPAIISKVASKPEYGFVAGKYMDPGKAIATFAEALVASVIKSGNAIGTGQSGVHIDKPEGFELALDLL